MIQELIDDLREEQGVREVDVEITIEATVRKQNTGEVDDVFNEIRERVISEEEMESIADDHDYNYHGTVDVMGDYYVKDRLTKRLTPEK